MKSITRSCRAFPTWEDDGIESRCHELGLACEKATDSSPRATHTSAPRSTLSGAADWPRYLADHARLVLTHRARTGAFRVISALSLLMPGLITGSHLPMRGMRLAAATRRPPLSTPNWVVNAKIIGLSGADQARPNVHGQHPRQRVCHAALPQR